MKFKLDENFGSRAIHLFQAAGHDAETVYQEGLSGASDAALFEACILEQRCIVTLDLDFADVVRFPPHISNGIAVLRTPKNSSLQVLEKLVNNLLKMMLAEQITGRLWIVEINRIRIHDSAQGNVE